jgi:membrane protease YdiL (CAAX protease family)
MITETTFLIGEKDAAVLLSVILQTSYHLYQGLLPALVLGVVFLIFSLYFAKRGRILPVVLAHLYMDVIAFLAISK